MNTLGMEVRRELLQLRHAPPAEGDEARVRIGLQIRKVAARGEPAGADDGDANRRRRSTGAMW
jgi:hypothetical protein